MSLNVMKFHLTVAG